ncbi:MAG: protoporphyrinogen oxidase [Aquihabitans sp.]
MSRRAPDRVVVVGGGIAGLTAAFRLSQAGSHVTVVEPDRLGGKLQTSVFAGRPIDEAADAFLLRVPWAAALCHDLEIDGELVSPVTRTAHIFVDGTRHPMPTGHVMGVPTDLESLARTGLISADGLARVAHEPQIDPDPLVASGADLAIGPYLRRRLGDEVVDHLVDPLIGGINAGDTAELSLAAVVPQLDAAARSGDSSLLRSCAAQLARGTATAAAPVFATPIGGMARLVDALLALMPAVDVQVGRVDAIELTGSTNAVRVTLHDGTVFDADGVVVACPAYAAGSLLLPIAPGVATTLRDISHSSVSMVTLAFDRSAVVGDLDASGCLVPRDQETLLTAISYGTSKWAQWRHPTRDDVILRVSAGRQRDTRHLDLDDADLTATLLRDIDRVVGLRGDPTEVRVGRWTNSFPQYAPGHLDRVTAMEAELAALPGQPVALAGAMLRGVGVPACIHSGERAAADLGATWPTRRSATLLR